MIARRNWEAGRNPLEMLKSALKWAKNTERKRTLYYAALCRQVWDELPWISRLTTELAERQVDGEFDESVLGPPLEYIAEGVFLCAQSYHCWDPPRVWGGIAEYERYLIQIGFKKPFDADSILQTISPERLLTLSWLAYQVQEETWPQSERLASFHSVPFIRDLFGNPFKAVVFKESWRSDTVVALSKAMYESRDFSAMPILADALQDAGCESEDILTHCCNKEPHIRGCWVVDLVLAKM